MDKNYKKMLSDRLGMFVHYGLYSALAGSYKGKEIIGLGEWIQRRAEIPIDEYVSSTKEAFCPAPDFAERLVKSAKAAGAKYIVLTSKHHDGFCLFKTAVDGYNAYDFYGRDICRELMEACHKEGLELGFYYSHTLDWHEKNGAGNYELAHPEKLTTNRNYWDYPDNNIDFEEYYRRKCLPQVRELLTNYGKLKCIWFDYPHDITYEESLELRNLVKELQPDCLINSRIGHGLWDYNSLGDNGLPSTPAKFPTECLITLNHTWGYKAYDKDYKSSRSVIEILCRTLTANSTLLLNVGPMACGMLTEETYSILSDLGRWVDLNSEAVYGDIWGNPYKTTFDWGYLSKKDNSLFIYLKEQRESISLSGIKSAPISVSLLGDSRSVEFSYSGETFTFAPVKTDMVMPVYKVSFANPPEISDKLEIDSTRESLPVSFSSVMKRGVPESLKPIVLEIDDTRGWYGTHGMTLTRIETAHNWISPDDVLVWDVDFLEEGEYLAEVVCAEPSFETHCSAPYTTDPYTLHVGEYSSPVSPTVKYSYNLNTSGACNLRYAKDAGTFKIEKCGRYRIALTKEFDGMGIGMFEVKFKKIKG